MMINFTETEMRVLRVALEKARDSHSVSYISSCCGIKVLVGMTAKVDAVLAKVPKEQK